MVARCMYKFEDRWGDLGEVIGHVDLAKNELYTEWLRPQGLAAAWTVGHTICDEKGETLGGFRCSRARAEPPFTSGSTRRPTR